jgi:biotin transport system ATP-binding protein
MVILETRNLTKVFSNGVVALQAVNFCVRRGEMVVVAGCNGSGKTVLARHLNGLLRPSAGEVLVAGEAVTRNPVEARRRVGLVFQDSDSQIVGETVTADVAFGPENLGLTPAEVNTRVTGALEAVGLTTYAAWRPQQLSGGQKRKLAIAGVLAMRPQIMVLDEPFTGLDYPGVIQVLSQLVRLRRDGQTLVVITHELEKVLAHADRLALLHAGRLVAEGRPEELLDRVEEYGIKKPFGANRPVETMTWLK